MSPRTTSAPSNGVVLRWQRLLRDHVKDDRPTNHTTVLAVALVLVTHSNSDGSRCFPAQTRIAREAGIHRETAALAVAYLEDQGFIRHVRNRAHGLREYRLVIPQMSDESASSWEQMSGQMSDEATTEHPDVGSDVGSDVGPSGTTSVDLRVPPKSARSDDAAFEEWCRQRAASKDGGPGLVQKMLREDRAIFDAEQEAWREADTARECERCDHRGLVLDEEGLPLEPSIYCDHQIREAS